VRRRAFDDTGCIPHFAGSFTALSAEGGARPDVCVGSTVAIVILDCQDRLRASCRLQGNRTPVNGRDKSHAFVSHKETKLIKDYFKNYYFYPYDHNDTTCLVYSGFEQLTYEQGCDLYKYCEKIEKANWRVSQTIWDSEQTRHIDWIIGIKHFD
jgi:hypothetical protein